MEPDWSDFERRLMVLTVRELRELGRMWYAGMLGGASSKREIAHEMSTQARYWWHGCADMGGRKRVRNVMIALERMEDGDW